MISDIFTQYLGKYLRVYLGADWSFGGKLTKVDFDAGTIRLESDFTEFYIDIPAIKGISHQPNFNPHQPRR